MEANFDLLVSGCNTRCRHCYVNGGPAKNMPIEDALLCIEKLDELAAVLPFPASFTLDNEPINHPEIVSIIRAASSAKHIAHFHHGMTTGIALMQRNDRDKVIGAYLEHACTEFGITLHGAAEHHDEIVRREDAHQKALEAAAYLKARGASINISLMFNRFFAQDADELARAVERLEPDFIYFAVPNYTPHAWMHGFEPYRGSLAELYALAPYLEKWGLDADKRIGSAEQNAVGAVTERLERLQTLEALFIEEQNELYLSVHGDCGLYIGNTGAETLLIGDLRSMDIAKAAEAIALAPGNRDYGAFYDIAALPELGELVRTLKKLPADRLYGDPASVIYRGLAEMNIKTKLLSARRSPLAV